MSGAVLVTGAGGFIGSAVVRLFARSFEEAPPRFWDGAPVTRLVALLRPGGSLERLQEIPRSPDWRVEHADMANPSDLRAVLERIRPRAILHVAQDKAAYTDISEAERRRLFDAPLEVLFESLAGARAGRLIHTGSAWVLPGGGALSESAPAEARSPYAAAKLREDALLPVLQARTNVDWINLRLFNTFGKYEKRTRLLPYLVDRLSQGQGAALSHGRQVRDFSNVEDMARAYRLALEVDAGACGRVYHIGSGTGMTMRSFAMTVAEVTGNANLIRFGASQTADQDLPSLVADPSLARRRLGWSPAKDTQARIRDAARWWMERLGNGGRACPGVERREAHGQ